MGNPDYKVYETNLDSDPEREGAVPTWWTKKDDVHKHVWAVVDGIEHRQQQWFIISVVYASLYENVSKLGLSGTPIMVGYRNSTGMTTLAPLSNGNRSQHNVVKSCVDTAYARIAKNNPRVKFTTYEGSWSDAQRARRLTQYVDGVMYAAKGYEQGGRAFRDCEIFPFGCAHVYVETGSNEIRVERVIPIEIIVDEDDGAHMSPRQLHRKREMPREVLIAAYPKCEADIRAASSAVSRGVSYADNVIVVESWHRPSGHGAGDGRHCLTLNNCTLLDESYEKDYFPFVFWRWTDRVASFWGMSLCEEMAGIQLRINKLDHHIDATQDLLCLPRVFVDVASQVETKAVWAGGIVKYRGTPPVFSAANGAPGEMYSDRDGEISRAYELPGVSQLSASAQKPAGLNSAVGLREFSDQTSERFSTQGKRYEDGYVEMSRIIIDLSRDLYKANKKLAVRAVGSAFIKRISWADADLDEDRYIMRAWPVSQLPQTPEGKLQFVQELAQAGWIDQDMAKELMELGNLDQGMGIMTAAFDAAMKAIEMILDDGKPVQPEPFFNLELTLKLAQACYNHAWSFQDPAMEDNLRLLRDFMEAIIEMQAQESAKNAPPPSTALPGPGGTPIAQPATPPTSDLLPVQA